LKLTHIALYDMLTSLHKSHLATQRDVCLYIIYQLWRCDD